jgi:hypothetical protein
MTVTINLFEQRAYVYRNGVRIGAATISSGKRDYETPTGSFTVLQKDRDHRSRKYDNAPMPYTLRLTWGGISLHGGGLPGHPSSHGCVHLPMTFSKALFDETRLGMAVTIIDDPPGPQTILDPGLLVSASAGLPGAGLRLEPGQDYRWQADLPASGPVTIMISARDNRMLVLRNGTIIGRARVAIPAGIISGTEALQMRGRAAGLPEWVHLGLPGHEAERDKPLDRSEASQIRVPAEFHANLDAILVPGTTVVMTDESISDGGTGPVADGRLSGSLMPAF